MKDFMKKEMTVLSYFCKRQAKESGKEGKIKGRSNIMAERVFREKLQYV